MVSQHPSNQWFYDDRGYYNYVLLNASRETFQRVQDALKNNGIGVLKAATSFRPASNGIQYRWYIRIDGDYSRRPSRDKIRSIVEGVLEKAQVPAIVKDDFLVSQFRNQLREKDEKIDELSRKIAQLQRERTLFREQLTVKNEALEKGQQEIERLNQQIVDLFKPEDVQVLRDQYERRLRDKDKQLKSVHNELEQFLQHFDTQDSLVSEQERTIMDLRNRVAMLEQENKEILSVQGIREKAQDNHEKGNPENLFCF